MLKNAKTKLKKPFIKSTTFTSLIIIVIISLAAVLIWQLFYQTNNQQNKEIIMQNAREYSGNLKNKTIIGFIGDSITYGDPFPNSNAVQTMLKELGDKYLYVNDGVNGQTSQSYINEFLPLALRNFQYYKVKQVCIMLGTNDARDEIAETVNDYKTNLQYIIAKLKNIGINKIILNAPPNFNIIDFSWSKKSKARIKQYTKALDQLVDSKYVYKGDRQAWTIFDKQPNLLFDDLHPNQIGYKVLGELWAQAYKDIK
ncbi:MAG: SGNH/GDSL hydrolase family protein [Bifidobacteriaceae bacterium]|jgi:lysophospholipase L1-like esterase|nr:SGNH/GDSL hydrolase family protein [Bifidobacteriaceae bacterium]